MSLLDLAKEIKQNYKPETDKINGNDPIPAGEYDGVISDVKYFFSETSGWENVNIDVEITTGEQAGRKERVSFSFIEEWNGKPIPDFVLKRNMKTAQKLAYLGGYEFKETDFVDTNSVALALKNIIGTQLILTIKETKNKKDPSNPYRNYEFDEYPNFGPDNASQIGNDDVPFL